MQARPLWILADPHAGKDAHDDAPLQSLFARARHHGPLDLLILGDLFTAWLAPRRFWTPLQTRVLDGLKRLKDSGTRVSLVIGNRDYLVVEAGLNDVFDQIHAAETTLDLAGRKTLVLHGDGILHADRLYRAWRGLSRSQGVTAGLLRLPGGWGRTLAASTERRLSRTNQTFKTGLAPLSALETVGRRAKTLGAQQALVGHFHHDRVVDVNEGAPVIMAPGWCMEHRVLVADNEGRLRSTPLANL